MRILFFTIIFCAACAAAENEQGFAVRCGRRYDPDALTCALKRRGWYGKWRVTNMENGKSVVVVHTDYGENLKGTGAARYDVVILTPAAFEALGAKKEDRINVRVEKNRDR